MVRLGFVTFHPGNLGARGPSSHIEAASQGERLPGVTAPLCPVTRGRWRHAAPGEAGGGHVPPVLGDTEKTETSYTGRVLLNSPSACSCRGEAEHLLSAMGGARGPPAPPGPPGLLRALRTGAEKPP